MRYINGVPIFDNVRAAINEETLAADKTLTVSDYIIQWLDPNGADRKVIGPSEASSTNLLFMVLNTANGAGEDLLYRDSGDTTTIATIGPGQMGMFSCNGTDWKHENDVGLYYDSVNGTARGIVESWYGVTFDESTPTSACVRTGALTGVAASSSPGDSLLPIQASMRRCVLSDNGVVQYYLDPTSSYNRLGGTPTITGTDDAGTASKLSDVGIFTLDESEYKGKYVHNTTDDTYSPITAKDSNDVLSIADDIMDIGEVFEICTARIADSVDGQVMVEVPAFYLRYGYSGTEHTWDISFVPMDGFSLHHAFIKNGVAVPYRYSSAYEGSMWDASAGAMVPDANIEDAYTIAEGDLLCSVSGQYPKTNETRDEFRNLATRRGTGWRQFDYDLASAIQLLILVEYADFNSQSMISNGRTMFSGGSWEAANQGVGKYIGETGYSNALGNASGGHSRASAVDIAAINTDTDSDYHDYMTYRGIENFFGNVWKWMDGMNINDNVPYVCNDDSDFQDDTTDNYTALGITLINADGYQKTLEQTSRGFLTASVGGSDSTYITDYYYQAVGWRVVSLGGSTTNALNAGTFDMSMVNASSGDSVAVCGRLSY